MTKIVVNGMRESFMGLLLISIFWPGLTDHVASWFAGYWLVNISGFATAWFVGFKLTPYLAKRRAVAQQRREYEAYLHANAIRAQRRTYS